MPNDDDAALYTVLINHEEQYSLWLRHHPVPQGWRRVGVEGTKAECCRYVDETWKDMRPLSLRSVMSGP